MQKLSFRDNFCIIGNYREEVARILQCTQVVDWVVVVTQVVVVVGQDHTTESELVVRSFGSFFITTFRLHCFVAWIASLSEYVIMEQMDLHSDLICKWNRFRQEGGLALQSYSEDKRLVAKL